MSAQRPQQQQTRETELQDAYDVLRKQQENERLPDNNDPPHSHVAPHALEQQQQQQKHHAPHQYRSEEEKRENRLLSDLKEDNEDKKWTNERWNI